MISVDNITISFGGWDLLSSVTFLVNDKDRVALVGKNGAGKSSLMKVIAAINTPTSGTISKSSDTTVGYLPQQMELQDGRTVKEECMLSFSEHISLEKRIEELNEQIATREDYLSAEYESLIHSLHDLTDQLQYMGGTEREAEVEKSLIGLGFEREDFERQTKEFSGGWRMRIELAKILLRRPSVMLLDEPTNHLDIESIAWLEEYLTTYSGAVLLISHDRMFLDTVTNRTIEIVMGKIHDYKVNYTKFVELRKERIEQQRAAWENQQKLIQSTQEFIDRFRYKPSKSNQVQSRVKQLEKIDVIEIDPEELSAINIKFAPASHCGQIVLEVKDAGKSFDDKHIFSGAEFIVEKGDRIALIGRNGEGKTTFARMITGDTPITRGSIRIGHNVKIGYLAQNQEDLMNGDFTVYDTLDKVATGDIRTKLRDILGVFLFRGEDVDKKVKVLSGGERSRLAMARLMLEPYNLLILDEPTNHMDMRSKDILKSAIQNYDGTVIVVSHDREFLDGLTNKLYEFSHGKVKEHLGGIREFMERKKLSSLSELNLTASQTTTASPTTTAEVSDSKQSYEQRKEQEKQLRKIRNQIEKAEKEIEKLDVAIALWEVKLSNPESHNIDLSSPDCFKEYNNLKQQKEEVELEWLELEEQIEKFNIN